MAALPDGGDPKADLKAASGDDHAKRLLRSTNVDYRALLPERYDVGVETCYRLDKSLGEGGFSTVVAARDRQYEGRVVAIKRVIKRSPKHVDSFHREAALMRELDHPNICRLFELFEDSKHLFFVMELCAGGELLERILANKVISESLTADILDQVARALRYAHSRKVAHRDLKPENVCFCSKDPADTSVKVIDWGLGALFADEAMTSTCGTMLYSAPEVLCQEHRRKTGQGDGAYGCACDVWSFGVLAYVMLCGRPPFWGPKPKMVENIRAASYPMNFPPWTGGTVSKSAQEFIKSLLQPDPARRPTSEALCDSPWLREVAAAARGAAASPALVEASAEVMRNLREFSRVSHFRQLCIVVIARQLDHRHLRNLERVFRELDTSGDGVISLEEVREGFHKILGEGASGDAAQIEELFNVIDLDGSGTIDYTEFCAAGLGKRVSLQEEALWAAFRSLDQKAVGARLTCDDITSVLVEADVGHVSDVHRWGEVAHELLQRWDKNSDGGIDFEEFRELMKSDQGFAAAVDAAEQAAVAAAAVASPSSPAAPASQPAGEDHDGGSKQPTPGGGDAGEGGPGGEGGGGGGRDRSRSRSRSPRRAAAAAAQTPEG